MRPMRAMLIVMLMVPLLFGCYRTERDVVSADDGVELDIPEFDPETQFSGFFAPVEVDVNAQTPGYDLPLDVDACYIADALAGRLSDEVREMIARQGFAVLDYGTRDDIATVYEWADDMAIPPFVTVDTLLHLYHLQFDQTLKTIEEDEFAGAMADFAGRMMQQSEDQRSRFSGDLREAALRNAAYFGVALRLLEPEAEVPAEARSLVEAEVELIEAQGGFSPSPIFGYREDYSQYVPRGHYTRSETLERYFKAMMWFGRMPMVLKGGDDALVSEDEARLQTQQALLIAATLHDDAFAEELQTWQRIYAVTAFYVGFADDLTPREYAEAIRDVAGVSLQWSALESDEMLFDLKSKLATFRAPRIYGGTGEVVLNPPFSPEQLDDLLTDTMGMRLMGQRFIPDGYIMQELGFPRVGDFTGEGRPFSLEMTAGGPQRVFPRGLDVMAALGSERAYALLDDAGDTAWANYDKQLAKMRGEFGELSAEEWHRNLYFGWLRALQELVTPVGEGYPSFMRTDAWLDRSLWAALASWTELRHDTILYAKQPYIPVAGEMPMQETEEPPPGFVEPRPGFYARMLELARMSREGLTEMDVLSDEASARMQALEEIIQRLLTISQTELRGEAMSDEDARWIKGIASQLRRTIVGIEDEEDKTTIVADVLTDTNTQQVLEEGVGHVKLLVAAYQLPDGRTALGVGPVLSYYEFKHPIDDRLTDEAWRRMLHQSPPEPPEWTASFYVGD